jgi:hypothetical protein
MTPITVRSFDLVAPICKALDLGDPNLVRKITLTPTRVTVELFLLNENGMKYVDLTTGEPATEERSIPVRQ